VLADGLNLRESSWAHPSNRRGHPDRGRWCSAGLLNAGIFANDEDTYQRFSDALKISGERFWRLPLDDDYRDVIKSTIADIKTPVAAMVGPSTRPCSERIC